jgi:two-component system chemotaxis response regulator CheB
MHKIRVLLVDDSVVVRRVVGELLTAEPGLEVVGTAPDGRIALDKAARTNPDVVVLDLEMPGMDGLQTLAALRQSHPSLKVILFSQHTRQGAAVTLEALAQGASDCVAKPENAGGMAGALRQVREQLVSKIRQFAPGSRVRQNAGATDPRSGERGANWELAPQARLDVVVVGVSTGGPNALATIVPALPADLPVPVLIVQHMPPLFTRLLAERLAAQASLAVQEAAGDEVLLPGQVWLAPGDHHLEMTRVGEEVRLRLHRGPMENSCRPSADVLFRSAAATCGAGVLAVVLTGMGQDGLRGAAAVRQAGGQVLAQDEASSVVWGMPGQVVRAGLAERVLPLGDIAGEIVRRAERGRSPSSYGQGKC